MDKELTGFLNIDKDLDWSSHDVVAKLRGILRTKKIGHAGTLDPFATGVLPIAVGSATRLIRFLRKSKQYLAEVDLSFTTDTDDLTGLKLKDTEQALSREEFEKKLKAMEGFFDQFPPLYSAKKINGKKLYELMREGKEINLSDIKSKIVHIKEIKVLSFNYPLAEFEVSCGEGTYIRSIARDTGGHLTKLRRLESNNFDLSSSLTLDALQSDDINLEDCFLHPLDYLDLPKLQFDKKRVIALQQGQRIYPDKSDEASLQEYLSRQNESENYLTCIDESEELIGLASILNKDGEIELQPKVIL